MKKYKRMKIYQHLDDLETVQKIIEAGGDIDRCFRKTKEHALFFALEKDVSIEVLKFLLDSGIDCNLQNKSGDTVIHVCDDLEKLELILNYDVDLNIRNKKSYTPIFKCNNIDKAKILVNHGIDVNVKDEEGKHFLKSLNVQDFDLMKVFIDHGMNRFLEKRGLTLDDFLETWSTSEVVMYYENKLKTQPEKYRVKV